MIIVMKSNIVGSLDKSFKLDKPNILKHVYLISYFPPKNSHGFLNSSFHQKGANFFRRYPRFQPKSFRLKTFFTWALFNGCTYFKSEK